MVRKLLVLASAAALVLGASCSKSDEATTTANPTTTEANPTTTAATTTTAMTETSTTADSGDRKSFVGQMALAELPSNVSTCMTDKADSDAEFKRIVESKANPTLAEAKQVIPVILSCMTKAEFAKVLLAASKTPLSAATAACYTTFIETLSVDDLAGMSADDQATADRINPQMATCFTAPTTVA